MGIYGEVYLVLDGKRYCFEDDLNIAGTKALFRIQLPSKMTDHVKETYFLDSFLGKEKETVCHREYIRELDIEAWLEDNSQEDSCDQFLLGVIVAYARLPGARIFFRSEFDECLGYYDSDASKEWEEKGWAKEFEVTNV
jgi:hypothetical protein